MGKVNSLNFSGQTLFCGIDVHKRSWRVNIRCNEFELADFSQDPREDILLRHLRKHYPGANYAFTYEAGFSGFSVQRKLSATGQSCIIVNPADVPSSDKDKKRKSDRLDARKLSRELSNGTLSGIYVPDLAMEHARSLVRQRSRLVRDQTRCKSRISHLLMFSGILTEQDDQGYWSNRWIETLRQLPCGSTILRQTLDLALDAYIQTRKLLSQATRQIRTLSREPVYAPLQSLLQSIPGIGPTNGMVIMTELQEMTRFRTLDKLCAYAGIVPDKSGSGERETVKGITHRSNSYLRPALVESSWIIIRKDPAMLLLYKQYCKKMVPNKAIIKISRHLLSRIRHVWLKQERYEVGIVG